MNIQNLFISIGIMVLIFACSLLSVYVATVLANLSIGKPKKRLETPDEFWKDLTKEEPVPCEECKCLINKTDASVVNVEYKNMLSNLSYLSFMPLINYNNTPEKEYYCKTCRPSYIRKVSIANGYKYYKEFEVDINGKIIK